MLGLVRVGCVEDPAPKPDDIVRERSAAFKLHAPPPTALCGSLALGLFKNLEHMAFVENVAAGQSLVSVKVALK